MKTILFSAALSLFAFKAAAADLGDSAPDLKIAKWVKGEPVQLSGDPKSIYVVEFWATWCPPCRTSIPHLTEIQKRFKDKNVTIIGVTDERESVVAPFVKNLGDKMDYRVVIDENKKTGAGYMQAYGINGIPHSFIVQDKKVLWHGHPMAGLDKTLEEVVAGKYDIAKAKAKFKNGPLYEKFLEAAAEGDDETADALGKQLQAAARDGTFDPPSFDPMAEKKQARLNGLRNEFRNAVFRDEKSEADEIAAKIKAIAPDEDLQPLRDEIILARLAGTYFEAITGEADSEGYKKIGEQLAAKVKGQPEMGNNIAWSILTDQNVKHRDIPLALQIAKQSAEDTNWKAPHVLDTYARALFDSGKKQEAIEYQEKALAAAADADKAQYERILKSYKEGKLPATE